MKMSADGLAVLKHYEGCRLTAYKCSAGVDTIGWGHTGPDVKPGMTITQARADELLVQDLEFFEGQVKRFVIVRLGQREFDALVSFQYNVGVGAFVKSTLLRRLNADERSAAADQFLRWDKSGGQRVLGLARRRASERALFRGASGADAIKVGAAVTLSV